MNGLAGMEKFSSLEDKIYLTIEVVKKLREENEALTKEVAALKRELSVASGPAEPDERLSALVAEREVILEKVEAMLDALVQIEPSISTAAGV
ncbi:MAG: cell division protein ZapB [Acidobacteria bacterium]|nr:cell division protein ZapB [Acidobacteriota bacterium]MCW5950516.1 cell division protein ZapB [Pyrinomonadaceae bacterium]